MTDTNLVTYDETVEATGIDPADGQYESFTAEVVSDDVESGEGAESAEGGDATETDDSGDAEGDDSSDDDGDTEAPSTEGE